MCRQRSRQHQLGPQEAGQHRLQPLPRLLAGPLPGGRDALQDEHHARADKAGRRQVLARQPEQQLRGVVLQRPREQELLQVLPPRPVDLVPAEVGGHVAQVVRAGLLAGAVAAQLADRDAQPLRQPGHRGGRGGGHVFRDEPQPRQRAQLHRDAQHVPLVPEPAYELLIGRREHEEPDQLSVADLGEAPQLRQLIRREHVPGRHRRTFPRRSNPDGEHLSDMDAHPQQNRPTHPHPARRYLAVMLTVGFPLDDPSRPQDQERRVYPVDAASPPPAPAALEEQRNGEWRYLEFLQVTSLITAGIFMREIPRWDESQASVPPS